MSNAHFIPKMTQKWSAGRALVEMDSPKQKTKGGTSAPLTLTWCSVKDHSEDNGDFSFCFDSEAIHIFLKAKSPANNGLNHFSPWSYFFPYIIHEGGGEGAVVRLRMTNDISVTPILIFNLSNCN